MAFFQPVTKSWQRVDQRRRRTVLGAGAGLFAGLAVPYRAQAQTPTLPASHSLKQELHAALQKKQVLIVMASLQGCAYCRIARASHLVPMQKAGQAIVQVDMRSSAMTTDFSGESISHDALIRKWNITVAPTLLFFGKKGVEVADRMEGAYLPDFYGPYLEQRLAQGERSL